MKHILKELRKKYMVDILQITIVQKISQEYF